MLKLPFFICKCNKNHKKINNHLIGKTPTNQRWWYAIAFPKTKHINWSHTIDTNVYRQCHWKKPYWHALCRKTKLFISFSLIKNNLDAILYLIKWNYLVHEKKNRIVNNPNNYMTKRAYPSREIHQQSKYCLKIYIICHTYELRPLKLQASQNS